MKSSVTVLFAAASFAAASLVALDPAPGGEASLAVTPRAEALLFRRIARSVGNAFRSATRAVGDAARNVGRAVGDAARNVGKAVGRAASTVVNAVKSVAEQAVELAKKGAAGLAELAKKGVEGLKAMGDLVKKGLIALGDLLEFVWKQFRDKLLGPVKDFFRNMIEKAKAAMEKLVDAAKQKLGEVFQAKVIVPALAWAIENLLPGGKEALSRIKVFVQRLLGKAESLAARQEELAAVTEALAGGDPSAYRVAMSKFEAGLNQWTNITLPDIVTQLIGDIRERIVEFVQGKTVDLLEMAYSVVEKPIELGKNAALSAIATIPFVGGLLRGAADFVITNGLKLLRSLGFQFVASKAAELAGKAVDALTPYLVRGAGALDAKLRPIVDRFKPYLDEAMKLVGGVRDEWFKLRDKLKEAGQRLAQAGR
jgi:hypothetical protein